MPPPKSNQDFLVLLINDEYVKIPKHTFRAHLFSFSGQLLKLLEYYESDYAPHPDMWCDVDDAALRLGLPILKTP